MTDQNPDNTGRNTLRRKLLGVAAVLLLGFAYLLATAPDGSDSPDPSPQKGLRTVTSQSVLPQTIDAEVRLSGILEADREVRLSVESSGRVVRTGAQAFDRVDAGDVLLEIDPVPAEIAVRQAQAQVDRTTSELALACTAAVIWDPAAVWRAVTRPWMASPNGRPPFTSFAKDSISSTPEM